MFFISMSTLSKGHSNVPSDFSESPEAPGFDSGLDFDWDLASGLSIILKPMCIYFYKNIFIWVGGRGCLLVYKCILSISMFSLLMFPFRF